MKKPMMLALAACLTVSARAALPEPTAWFRADAGLTIEDGKVVKWANQGSLGADLDLKSFDVTKNGFSLVQNAFGDKPGLRFTGRDILVSDETKPTALGINADDGSTIFFVGWVVSANNTRGLFYGLKDLSGTGATRFCAFIADNQGKLELRVHDFAAAGGQANVASAARMTQGQFLMARTIYTDSTSTRKVSLCLDGGVDRGAVNWGANYVPWSSQLCLGFQGIFSWYKPWSPTAAKGLEDAAYDGYIAEFRVYNRALTAAERFQVECELAAKYALTLKPDAQTTLGATALAGCLTDAVVLGAQPNGGAPMTALTTATSGNLTATVGAAAASSANSLVYVAHDGGTDAECVYGLAGAAEARALPLTLTFAQAYGKNRLFYRADAASEWSKLDVTPTEQGASATFELTAGWANGQYALSKPTVKPAAWFRADSGVTLNANGKVTGWDNLGTSGAALNLTNLLGEASHITVDSLNGKPALRIDHNLGLDFLVNEDPTDLGVTLAHGCTYFGVFTAENVEMKAPFGMDFDGSPRFGFQTASSWNPRYWYGHLYDANSNAGVLPYVEGEQLLGVTGWPTITDPSWWNIIASSFGDTLSSWKFAETSKIDLSKRGRLLVGGFIQSWGKQMFGRLAELRIYNRALTAQEYADVEFELAADYGLPCAGACGRATAGCANDRCVFGRDARRGVNPSVTVTSGTCGALSLALGGTPGADADSLVRVGRAGGEGTADRWCVAAGAGARALPLTLTFKGAAFADAGRKLRCMSANACWETLQIVPETTAEGVVYTLPAGWKSGRYAVATDDELTAASAAVWFRADKGVVQNASGLVTGWRNQGTLGASLDLENTAGDGSHIAVGTLNGRPALIIDHANGNEFLKRSEVDLGLTAANGCSYFVVGHLDRDTSSSFFGVDYGGSPRFGFQTAKTWNPRYWYALVPGDKNMTGKLDWPGFGDQLLGANAVPDSSGKWKVIASLFGEGMASAAASQSATTPDVTTKGNFLVGGFIESWGEAMHGSVAEVRVYDRALTAVEYACVEFELATRYGMALAGVAGKTLAGCENDVFCFGSDNGLRGPNGKTTATSGTCGALTVALDGTPSATSDAVVRLGRTDGAGTDVQWCVVAGAGATALPVTLTFKGDAFADAANRLRCKGASGTWRNVTEATVAVTADGIVYTLPSGWESGRYRVSPPKGIAIIVK